jgi:hypothetical protein
MDITIKFEGLKEVIANMGDMAKKQVPFALKEALNKTAEEVKAAEIKLLQTSVKGGPTPWTLNALYIKYANKNKPIAEIGYKDKSSIRVTTTNKGQGTPAAYYLAPNVEGGPRNLKRFESALQHMGVLPKGKYIVPGEACPLDANGNIPSSIIIQILSYFNAAEKSSGATANITQKRKAALAKGSKRTGFGFIYFVSYGSGKSGPWSFGLRSGSQHLPAGIYKRVKFSSGTAIKPIMMFVKRPSYSKRFPFHETAQKIINQKLKNNFIEAMRDALLTAKRPG